MIMTEMRPGLLDSLSERFLSGRRGFSVEFGIKSGYHVCC